MEHPELTAISPLDGRYAGRLEPLRELMSEAAFMRQRVVVEVAWLIALSDANLPELPPFSAASRDFLRRLVDGFGVAQAARIKEIERVTNHDVKAVEYFLKESVQEDPRTGACLGVHPLRLHLRGHQQHLARADAAGGPRGGAAARAGAGGRPAARRWPTSWPTCRCSRAPTASPPRRPRWARSSRISSPGSNARGRGSPASRSWRR